MKSSRQLKAEQIKLHLDQQQQSDLSIAEYCRQHSLNLKSFYNWRSNHKITRSQIDTKPAQTNWVEIAQPQPAEQINTKTELGTKITLSLPGGISLTLETH